MLDLIPLLFVISHLHIAAGFAEDGGSNTEIPNPERSDICFSKQIPVAWIWSHATCIRSHYWTYSTISYSLPGLSCMIFLTADFICNLASNSASIC